MYNDEKSIKIERAFWSTNLIDWANVRYVNDWMKFPDIWKRCVNMNVGSPYLMVTAKIIDGQVELIVN